ncbi:MAG: hypothetical protein MK105_18155 [Crocinitomicaceae bacterium]|nr:hypothetical protein [Crocinitomicaceae bacterium]
MIKTLAMLALFTFPLTGQSQVAIGIRSIIQTVLDQTYDMDRTSWKYEYTYDTLGRPLSKKSSLCSDQYEMTFDQMSRQVYYYDDPIQFKGMENYDKNDSLISYTISNCQDSVETTTFYINNLPINETINALDSLGNIIRSVSSDERKSFNLYDENGWLIRSWFYMDGKSDTTYYSNNDSGLPIRIWSNSGERIIDYLDFDNRGNWIKKREISNYGYETRELITREIQYY